MSCWVVLNGSASNIMELQTSHCFSAIVLFHFSHGKAPNGLRYAPSGVLVSGVRQRHYDGTHFKPHKLLENTQTPTTLVPPFSLAPPVICLANRAGAHLPRAQVPWSV